MSSAESTSITYDFAFDDGTAFHFEVPLQGWVETPQSREQPLPAWTELATDICTNCPLAGTGRKYCPAAVDLHAAAAKFRTIASYQRARVSVVVGHRTYVSECDMNTGLRSLFGLYMALSGCPITSRLRPLALRHLPFASMNETLSRVVSHYLLKQYFVMKSGGTPDWELKELMALYDALDLVSSAFVSRVGHASERDSNLNAICDFATFSRVYVMALDELLKEDKELFLKGF
ncbi:MAG: hypothetical protein HZA93_04425 [Verrucomicrobia bacterium]|nr:hypothetical protein [Verrucomicrobiota bacterium]